MSGVFGVSRKVFDHPMFSQKREFSKLEAWLWMLREAAWKERQVRVKGKTITLNRGQFTASIRFMAEAWSWKKDRVSRFIDALETEAMVATETETGQQVLTICKYDEYQKVALPERDSGETLVETAARQDRDSSATGPRQTRKKGKEGKEIDTPSGAQAPFIDFSNPTEAQLYAFGKFVLGKSAGGVITNLLKKCERDFVYAASWLAQAQEKENPMEWIQGVIRSAEMLAWRGVDGAPKPPVDFKTREERLYEDDWRKSPTWAGVDI